MERERFFAPEVQTMPRERLRALQEERLAKQVDRIFSRPVPFQRRRLEALGVRADDVRTLDDLARIPPILKDDLR